MKLATYVPPYIRTLSLHDLVCSINDEGGWEEFHQKHHNYEMMDHHKSRRKILEEEYRRRKA